MKIIFFVVIGVIILALILPNLKKSGSVSLNGTYKIGIPIAWVLFTIFALSTLSIVFPSFVKTIEFPSFSLFGFFGNLVAILVIVIIAKIVWSKTAQTLLFVSILFVILAVIAKAINTSGTDTGAVSFRLYFTDGTNATFKTPCTLNLQKGFNIESDKEIWFTVPGVSGVQHHKPGAENAKTLPPPIYNGNPDKLIYSFWGEKP